VLWAINKGSGKREPLDPEPVQKGNIVIVGQRDTPYGPAPVIRHLRAGEVDQLPGLSGDPRYLSHFATCPNRKQHRKDA
jgi:hypothetical protein